MTEITDSGAEPASETTASGTEAGHESTVGGIEAGTLHLKCHSGPLILYIQI